MFINAWLRPVQYTPLCWWLHSVQADQIQKRPCLTIRSVEQTGTLGKEMGITFHPDKYSAIWISRSRNRFTESTYLGHQVHRCGAQVKHLLEPSYRPNRQKDQEYVRTLEKTFRVNNRQTQIYYLLFHGPNSARTVFHCMEPLHSWVHPQAGISP